MLWCSILRGDSTDASVDGLALHRVEEFCIGFEVFKFTD